MGGPAEQLAPSQGTFWNTFTYKGERDFDGVYYQGKAKYYVMTGVNEPVREFWYFTDLDGKPVQQGEAGTDPTDQGFPTSIGHTIWHDYDPSTFDTSAIDASVLLFQQHARLRLPSVHFHDTSLTKGPFSFLLRLEHYSLL